MCRVHILNHPFYGCQMVVLVLLLSFTCLHSAIIEPQPTSSLYSRRELQQQQQEEEQESISQQQQSLPSSDQTTTPTPTPTTFYPVVFNNNQTALPLFLTINNIEPTEMMSLVNASEPSISLTPTIQPSTRITIAPTLTKKSILEEVFRQSYCGTEIESLTEEKQISFGFILELNTNEYGRGEPKVQTDATFISQELLDASYCHMYTNKPKNIRYNNDNNKLRHNETDRYLQAQQSSITTAQKELRVVFEMSWSSMEVNLSGSEYIQDFLDYMNNETVKEEIRMKLISVGVNVEQMSDVRIYKDVIKPPTKRPSSMLSYAPSLQPSNNEDQIVLLPSSTSNVSNQTQTTIIAASAVLVSILGLGFMTYCIFYRHRARQNEYNNKEVSRNIYDIMDVSTPEFDPNIADDSHQISNYSKHSNSNNPLKQHEVIINNSAINTTLTNNNIPQALPLSRAGSFQVSNCGDFEPNNNSTESQLQKQKLKINQSLPMYFFCNNHNNTTTSIHHVGEISGCYNEDGNLEEDELDQYKDPNLEQMRGEINNKVILNDGENMMSRAFVRALLMEDEDVATNGNNTGNSAGGGDGKVVNPLEIEANFLSMSYDWMKRMEDGTIIQKNDFLQNIINELVVCVLYQIISPNKASQIIHECSALLLLKLKQDLPGTTLLIIGMRKNVKQKDLKKAMRFAGDLLDVAVGSKGRGFGFVRYKTLEAANRALERFRLHEIVVQDVAVSVRKLLASRDPSLNNPANHSHPFLIEDNDNVYGIQASSTFSPTSSSKNLAYNTPKSSTRVTSAATENNKTTNHVLDNYYHRRCISEPSPFKQVEDDEVAR